MNIERFFLQTEIKSEPTDTSPGKLTGYVTKWNTLSHDRGGYRVVFRPDSFANLKDQDIPAYRDHEESVYLGRTSNNSLTLISDSIGLQFSLDLPDTQDGRDTAALVKRGDLAGMSFGYERDQYRWKKEDQGPILEHSKGNLFEISVVFSPAFPRTSVELNSLTDPSAETLQELHDFLNPVPVKRKNAERLLKIYELAL